MLYMYIYIYCAIYNARMGIDRHIAGLIVSPHIPNALKGFRI